MRLKSQVFELPSYTIINRCELTTEELILGQGGHAWTSAYRPTTVLRFVKSPLELQNSFSTRVEQQMSFIIVSALVVSSFMNMN